MTTTTCERPIDVESGPLKIGAVENEIAGKLQEIHGAANEPVMRAHLSNLVIYCKLSEEAAKITSDIPAIGAIHPARVLLLIGEDGPDSNEVTAKVHIRSHSLPNGRYLASEQVTLHASGQAVDRLPFAVRSLLIGDLPINLWWAVPEPPPFGGALTYDLAEGSQQIIYDSVGWADPARGIMATATWLRDVQETHDRERWRVVSDLNWRRLKPWRRLMAQSLDPTTAPGVLESITEILIEHGPHGIVQAWELASWMASRLGWRVQKGRTQQGAQISWQCHGSAREIRICLKRLSTGPSNIRRVHFACSINGRPGGLNATVSDDERLSIIPEGVSASPRTLALPSETTSDLVARQLSDREHDNIFDETMALARIMAQNAL